MVKVLLMHHAALPAYGQFYVSWHTDDGNPFSLLTLFKRGRNNITNGTTYAADTRSKATDQTVVVDTTR